jgi:hypothetical protein
MEQPQAAEAVSTAPTGSRVCDRCDKTVGNNWYACQDCRDFDYCPQCFRRAAVIHPGHSFKRMSPDGEWEHVEKEDGEASDQGEDDVDSSPGCRSCEPVTRLLTGLPVLLQQKELQKRAAPREVGLAWDLRLSVLIEATQTGCSFCAFVLTKFFGPSNVMSFAYYPSKPWYAEPLAHDEKRLAEVAHCMNSLTKLKHDRFGFKVQPTCTRRGTTLPDFDRLIITVSSFKGRDGPELRSIFNSAGVLELKADVFATAGNVLPLTITPTSHC